MSADFWAGYLSGAVGICIGNPFDILKVLKSEYEIHHLLANDVVKVRLQVGDATTNLQMPSARTGSPVTLLRGIAISSHDVPMF